MSKATVGEIRWWFFSTEKSVWNQNIFIGIVAAVARKLIFRQTWEIRFLNARYAKHFTNIVSVRLRLRELSRRSAERHPVAGYIDSKGSESA